MVDFKNVYFKYKGKKEPSIRNLNLKIQKGQCIVLCGRSGCGKTSNTRLLNGLITEFYPGDLTGSVEIDGDFISELPIYKISKKVGSVFQNPNTQFFNTDTDSEIAFGIENLSVSEEKLRFIVDKTFHDFKIEKLKNRSLFELSGGEKQKIAFASIYAMNPDIYVLDEPSSNLDSYAIDDLKEILTFLKSKGKTIIIAEHRLYYLKDLADAICYVEKGEIQSIYSPESFLKVPDEERKSKGLRSLDLNKVQLINKEEVKKDDYLVIKDMTLRYGKKEIIKKGFDVTASRGECICIIGHNGSGKTTFSKALCGLHKEYDGKIMIDGKNIPDKERLKKCYLVMQDVSYQLFAETVEEECGFGIKNFNKEDVLEILKDLDLYKYKDNHPNTLSGGQKQRLAVATSIVSKREILIFDEPTSGLDYDNMIRVSNLIEKLRSEGKLIFLVTHDYEFICNTCTRTLHFDEGALLNDYSLLDEEGKNKLKKFFILKK